MGFMGSMLGLDSGNKGGAGMNYQAGSADLIQPATGAQANQLYGQVQGGLSQQQAFINALQAQGGIGNQTNVFAQQQALANQLGQMSQGQGPNPAQAQLNQNTAQNINNQAALMAGQRGASANAGLMARQAAMQGANIQQNAVGQAATLQAQQQIAATQALQNQQGMMGNLATQQVNQQGNAIQGYNQAAQGAQQNVLGAIGNYNNAGVSNMSSQNSANAAVAGVTGQNQGKFWSSATGGLGTMIMPKAHGGEIEPPQLAPQVQIPQVQEDGGGMDMATLAKLAPLLAAQGGMIDPKEPASFAGKHFKTMKSGGSVPGTPKIQTNVDTTKNDTVPTMLSPGEVVIPRSVMNSADPVSAAAKFVQAVIAKKGMRK